MDKKKEICVGGITFEIEESNNIFYGNTLFDYCFNSSQNGQSCSRNGDVIPSELKMDLKKDSCIFYGRMKNGEAFVGKPADEDGHIIVIAPTGGGKTEGVVKPSMKTCQGSQIIIDPKGNLQSHWKKINKHSSRKLKVFNPSDPEGKSCGYDPFAPLQRGDITGKARILALSLITLIPFDKNKVWTQTAQNFLTSTIIYYFNEGYSFVETMTEILLLSITDIIKKIMSSNNLAAKIYISKLSDVQTEVIGNIGMELSNLAALVTDSAILSIYPTDVERDMIDWEDLNTVTEPIDIILVFLEANMERLEPLMKLMVNQLVLFLEERPQRTYEKGSELLSISIIFDEFTRLGKISAIENGLRTSRCRGVTFVLIIQSFADLDLVYGPLAARAISENCTYKIIFCIADPISQDYFSKAIGTIEVLQRGVSVNIDPFSRTPTSFGINISKTQAPIIHPHEFLTMTDVIVINPINGFFRVDKILFYEHEELFLNPQSIQNHEDVVPTISLSSSTDEGSKDND
jgi:type IV secretory pathway TraG/TraD family ATPase VirD4